MILGADKGRATVVMNTVDYKRKVQSLLEDKDTYEKLKKDPTNIYKNRLISILREWKNKRSITDNLYHRIYPTSDIAPKFYGLPKIHKANVPLRPIVSSIGNITYHLSRYLTQMLSPLMGKNPHFIKNSADFVKKIKELEIPPGRKMISYDVTALFTSIPVDKALEVIRHKLQKDTHLSQRCELTIDQLLTLLAFCLNTTYFVYEGFFYKQKQGAAMGSSVSPVVANLYMEDFEEKAISSAPYPPYTWLRYVDDTFVVLHEYDVDSFTTHINSIDPNIKFTTDPEKEGKLPFLDTEITINDDATLSTRVYRKPTHTDQYLNWKSNHHLEHKRSVVRTLLQRAEIISSDKKEKEAELLHIKNALAANGYQPWILKLPKKKAKEKPPQNKITNKKISPVPLPYIQGLSENIQRLFTTHNIPSFHKPFNTLRSLLVKPKDATPKGNQCGLIYHIKCSDCHHNYIGETGRNMETRLKEHTSRKGTVSAIKDYLTETGHSCTMNEVSILDREENWYRRKVKEALMILRHEPSLNRDRGLELPPVYSTLLSHDLRGSCDTSAPQHSH
jgi:predicted GIY-YIG superfamily endonuclease